MNFMRADIIANIMAHACVLYGANKQPTWLFFIFSRNEPQHVSPDNYQLNYTRNCWTQCVCQWYIGWIVEPSVSASDILDELLNPVCLPVIYWMNCWTLCFCQWYIGWIVEPSVSASDILDELLTIVVNHTKHSRPRWTLPDSNYVGGQNTQFILLWGVNFS